MFVDFNILNQLGSPSINSNTFANRPAAGQTGRLFVSTDTFEIYRDNGTTWDLIGGPGSSTVTGTGAATQVAYWTAAQAIGGSNNLWWDNTSGFLGVGSNAPTARIEAVKTDGIGIYANYTTNAGSGSSATAIWAKNVTNSSGYSAVIEETTPNTTAGQYPLLIKHSLSSGTAGVGMGTGVHWQLPDDAGTFKTTQLTVETIDAAAATYKTRYRFNVQNNGSSLPVAYINSTGLGIFTATPGAALDIHSTGIMVQLNSTSATANSLLAFQRSGSGLWRIGDQYNGGNNFFELHNTVLTNNAIQVLASSNEATFLSSKTYSTGNAIGVAVQHNLTIPNAVNVGLAAIGGVNSNLNLTLGGSTTVAATGRQGLEGSTSISFTGAGTLTMTQGSTVRAFSALSSVYAFNGSAVGTITHLAGLRICFPDNVGSAVNITNNYALLINNQTTGTGTVSYTNRWGIYQEGASDLNYMAANLLLGSTVNTGDKLQVTGTGIFSSTVTAAGVNTFLSGGLNNTTYALNASISSSASASTVAPVARFSNNGGGYVTKIMLSDNNRGDAFITHVAGSAFVPSTRWLGFGVDAVDQIILNASGLVGIGTIAPAYLLDVNGQARFLGNASTNSAAIFNNTAGASGTPQYYTEFNVGATQIATMFRGNGASGVVANGLNIDCFAGFQVRANQLGGSGDTINLLGGNVLIGTTTDAGQKLQVNGSVTSTTITQTQTSATAILKQIGNSNAEGAAQKITIVRQYSVVSLGTKLIIPFTSQTNLNSTTICKVFGHGARYNSRGPLGFEITFAVGHLNLLDNLSSWNGNGNYASIAINGMSIEITFTANYTAATSDGVFVTIEYMTGTESYSIDVPNIAMN